MVEISGPYRQQMSDARLPNGNKGLPVAHFRCWDDLTFSPHFAAADNMYWYDGDEQWIAGWYCGMCYPEGLPEPSTVWTLAEEIMERDALYRLL